MESTCRPLQAVRPFLIRWSDHGALIYAGHTMQIAVEARTGQQFEYNEQSFSLNINPNGKRFVTLFKSSEKRKRTKEVVDWLWGNMSSPRLITTRSSLDSRSILFSATKHSYDFKIDASGRAIVGIGSVDERNLCFLAFYVPPMPASVCKLVNVDDAVQYIIILQLEREGMAS